eukprot:scaffold195447_cov32-Attheya_sp.AAC.1
MARDPVLGFAAAEALGFVVPCLVFSLAGVLDQHPLISIIFPEAQMTELVSNSLAKDLFECFLILVLMFGVGYWRLYVDGPEHHPILLCMGGIGKLMVASIMYRMYTNGHMNVGIIPMGVIPDAALGFYFLYLWRGLDFRWVSQEKKMSTD